MPEPRHILSLSGGKDSTALAVYMRDRLPNMEYVFCDTRKELPETYSYLDQIEAFLGKKITRLPSTQARPLPMSRAGASGAAWAFLPLEGDPPC